MARIQHQTLRQEALGAIRRMILAGELERGAQIVEQDLAQRLGVSRGPVRESLRQLEQEGLVAYEANRGCFVRQVTARDILEADLLQFHLEAMALELQGGALPDAVLDQLEGLVGRMSVNGPETTPEDMMEEDDAFHRLIIQSAGMDRLYRVWSGISQNSIELEKKFRQDPAFLIQWHRELHISLLDALRTKDMAVIRPALLRHCLDVVRFITDGGAGLDFDLDELAGTIQK